MNRRAGKCLQLTETTQPASALNNNAESAHKAEIGTVIDDEKMTRLTSELSVMFKRSHELEDEIRQRLGAIGYEI